jgi:hypothetical protein
LKGQKKVILITSLLSASAILATATTATAPTPIKPIEQNQFTVVLEATRPPPVIYDNNMLLVREKPGISQVDPKPKVIVKSPQKVYSHSAKGLASWYCSYTQPICRAGYGPTAAVAAAGPKLRIAMGGGASATAPKPWEGKTVKVCGSEDCLNVKLVDWCQCHYKEPNEKIIDLYKIVFDTVGASKGLVTISW